LRVQPIFVSVDPDRDTPERLAKYVRAFDPRILGATGSVQQLDAFASGYGVYVNVARHNAGNSTYGVEHASSLLLIGANGELISVIESQVQPADLARRIRTQLQRRDG
jgi:protein SCO1